MDWTTLLAGSPLSGLLPSPGDPTSSAANAPMNILPAVAQTSPTQPTGILNGAQPNNNGSDLIAQGMKMVQQPQSQTPALPQINYARPVGSAAGFDPSKLLAAMRGMPITA